MASQIFKLVAIVLILEAQTESKADFIHKFKISAKKGDELYIG
jgi:hypothetical protein